MPLARSGVALGLMLAGAVLFLGPVVMATVAAWSASPVTVWVVGGAVTAAVVARIARLGAHVDAAGLVVRNPLRTRRLPWGSIAAVRWQCLKAGALDRVLPPNCRLLVETRDGDAMVVQATVYLTSEQRDAIERIVRASAPDSVRAFTRQPSGPSDPASPE